MSLHPVPAFGAAPGTTDIVREATVEKSADRWSDKITEYLGSHNPPANAPPPAPVVAAQPPSASAPTIYIDTGNDPVCERMAEAAKDIMIVVDAPSSLLYSHMSSRLQTSLRCAPVTVFSTVAAQLGAHKVHDVLYDIAKETRGNYSQFEFYDRQRNAQSIFADLSSMTDSSASELYRWTVIPSLVKAYEMDPSKKFFFLMTPTTYVSINNLIAWASTLDPASLVYAGAQRIVDDIDCAEIQPGVLLSQASVAALAKSYRERKSVWEYVAGKHSSADPVLGLAMKEAHIPFSHAFPIMQTEDIVNIGWRKELWCKSPVSWGTMTPSMMEQIWSFERNWTLENMPLESSTATSSTLTTKGWFAKRAAAPTGAPESMAMDLAVAEDDVAAVAAILPVLPFVPAYNYSHLLTTVLIPLFTTNRTSWTNHASKWVLTDKSRSGAWAHNSFETCRSACDIRANSGCIQWVYEHNSCSMGNVIRLGGPADDKLKSGWNLNRVKKAVQQLACDDYFGPGAFMKIRAPATWQDKVEDKKLPVETTIVEDAELEDKQGRSGEGSANKAAAPAGDGGEAASSPEVEQEPEPLPEVEFDSFDEIVDEAEEELEVEAAQDIGGGAEA